MKEAGAESWPVTVVEGSQVADSTLETYLDSHVQARYLTSSRSKGLESVIAPIIRNSNLVLRLF
jgi:hypothetical protein